MSEDDPSHCWTSWLGAWAAEALHWRSAVKHNTAHPSKQPSAQTQSLTSSFTQAALSLLQETWNPPQGAEQKRNSTPGREVSKSMDTRTTTASYAACKKGVCELKISADFPTITKHPFQFCILCSLISISNLSIMWSGCRNKTCHMEILHNASMSAEEGKLLTHESSVHVQIENCLISEMEGGESNVSAAYGSSKTAGGSLHPPSPGGAQAMDVNQPPRNFCLHHRWALSP